MGHKKREKAGTPSSDSSENESSSSDSDTNVPPRKRSKKHSTKEKRPKVKEDQQERSRWESPDCKERKYSPTSRSKGKHHAEREDKHKARREPSPENNDGNTRWDREAEGDGGRKNERNDHKNRHNSENPTQSRRRDEADRDHGDNRQVTRQERFDRNEGRERRESKFDESRRGDDRFDERRSNDRRHNNERRNHEDKRNNDERRNNEDRRYNDDRRNNGDRRSNEGRSPRRGDRNTGFEDRDNRRDRDSHGRGRGNGRNRGNSRRGGRGSWFGSNNESRSRFDGNRMKSEPSPEWGRAQVKTEDSGKPKEKEMPNFEPSGKLTEDANTVNGVVIKYTEPMEARKPKRQWRLYPFKGEKVLPTLYIHRQSAYLMGRDRKIADIPLDHPSCSKQHAALQFRLVNFQRENGSEGRRIRPYLIDLESANGTFVNDVKLEPRRYHELLERDVLRFGFSSREYVMLHEQSKDDTLDDDVPLKDTTQK